MFTSSMPSEYVSLVIGFTDVGTKVSNLDESLPGSVNSYKYQKYTFWIILKWSIDLTILAAIFGRNCNDWTKYKKFNSLWLCKEVFYLTEKNRSLKHCEIVSKNCYFCLDLIMLWKMLLYHISTCMNSLRHVCLLKIWLYLWLWCKTYWRFI